MSDYALQAALGFLAAGVGVMFILGGMTYRWLRKR